MRLHGLTAIFLFTLLPGLIPGRAQLPAAPLSRVVLAERPAVVQRFSVDAGAVQIMFNDSLLKLTRQSDVASAWRKGLGIVPQDVVGIKITTQGGQLGGTRRALLDAIVQGLVQAGVNLSNIIIWDKFESDMLGAGYKPNVPVGKGVQIRSVLPGDGYDGDQFYKYEVLGKLIWGDYLFVGKKPSMDDLRKAAADVVARAEAGEKPKPTPAPDQTSDRSFYTKIVTKTCTKIINVPALSDHALYGMQGCLSSLAIGSVDNTRRFQVDGGYPAIGEILAKDWFKNKVVLHVLDALIAQYAGGPDFQPQFTQSLGAFYLSRDPVAIDSLALARLEEWRKASSLSPLGDLSKHVAGSTENDLGESDPRHIQIVRVP
jgi:hypothetical protein